MKKTAALFLGCSLLLGCANANGVYGGPWSKGQSRIHRAALSSLGVFVGGVLSEAMVDSPIPGAIAGFFGCYWLARWLEFFPQSGDHLKKTGRVVHELISYGFLERIENASRRYLQYELKIMKETIVREFGRLNRQINQKDLYDVQRDLLKDYLDIIWSAEKQIKGILKAIEDEEAEEDTIGAESAKRVKAFIKDMESKRELFPA